MKFKLIIVLISMLFSANIFAQENALQSRINDNNNRFIIPADIKDAVDTLFHNLKAKKYRIGLEKFLINSPISKKDTDFKTILEQLQKAIELYGDIYGYEIVDFKNAGSSFFRINILGLHNKYPTRWEINFYRSPNIGLIVANFKFDDVSEIYLD